jgi:hypothetical protein
MNKLLFVTIIASIFVLSSAALNTYNVDSTKSAAGCTTSGTPFTCQAYTEAITAIIADTANTAKIVLKNNIVLTGDVASNA